jgi:hypothetical protein
MKLLIMLAVIAAPVAAAAKTPDVKELVHSTEVFTRCAKIADDISAMKVPEGHAEARAQKASHAHPEAKGEKVKIEDHHMKFIDEIEAKVKALDECGKEYEVAVKESEELTDKIRDMHLKEEDGKPLIDVFTKYHGSKDVLTDSIAKLSNDIQIQSYVHKVLVEHFLKDHKKKA